MPTQEAKVAVNSKGRHYNILISTTATRCYFQYKDSYFMEYKQILRAKNNALRLSKALFQKLITSG